MLDETTIRAETCTDFSAIQRVNRLAFGQEDEANLVDELRAGDYVRVSLIAEVGNMVVGHILFSDLQIQTLEGIIPALCLAPLAVVPERQRRGIGSALIREGLHASRDRGDRIVVVLGHPEYYREFGFSAELARPLDAPFAGEAFMALELTEGALAGVEGKLRYPSPFGLD